MRNYVFHFYAAPACSHAMSVSLDMSTHTRSTPTQRTTFSITRTVPHLRLHHQCVHDEFSARCSLFSIFVVVPRISRDTLRLFFPSESPTESQQQSPRSRGVSGDGLTVSHTSHSVLDRYGRRSRSTSSYETASRLFYVWQSRSYFSIWSKKRVPRKQEARLNSLGVDRKGKSSAIQVE